MSKTICLSLTLMLVAVVGCHLDTWYHFHEYPCGQPVVETTVYIESQEPEVETESPEPSGEMEGGYWARTLVFQITADYPEGIINPDEILVDGKVPEPRELWEVGPQHTILVRKAGYETIRGPLNIPPGFGDYTVMREMVCKERKVVFRITDSATGATIEPDQVLIGAQEIKDGDMVKPGDTTLEIKKRGYQSIIEAEFSIEPGEGSYILKRQMTTGKVELRFEFTDAKTHKPISADAIVLGERPTRDGSFVEPGVYQLMVSKQGYNTYKKRIQVPQVPIFTIKVTLTPATIRLYWKILPDYPKDLGPIDPVDRVLLDGREIEEGAKVSPGKHDIEFRQSGFAPLLDTINIPANKRQFNYTGEMISLPRLVAVKVRYDIAPPKNFPPYQVRMRNIQTNATYRQSGVRVKPGTYQIEVTQQAYRAASIEKRIFPASYPEEIEVILNAEERVVQAEVSFDVEPPPGLKPHMITFVEQGKNYSRTVKSGGRIRPGIYTYEVEKPGYKMEGGKKRVNIEPSNNPFRIVARMIAQPRKISFDIVDDKGRVVELEQVMVDGEIYEYGDLRPRSTPYKIEATFAEYRKVTKEIVLPPGVGPYSVPLELSK